MITLFWLYRGLRRGLYPALNVFLVLFISLLVTLNYYDLMFDLVKKVAPESALSARETISFIATYLVVFVFFLYFCLWLCADVMRLHRAVDVAGGGILGVATGIVCSGVLTLVWFSMPFAEREFPVHDSQLFFDASRMTLKAVTAVGEKVRGERAFDGNRFLRDLRYGLPQIPDVGAGIYVSSIPAGLHVFIDATGRAPAELLDKVKEKLGNPDAEVPPSEAKQPFGYRHRTPVFIQESSAHALIAVVWDNIPEEIGTAQTDASKMFQSDGEVYYAKEAISDRPIFIKIYRVPREGNIGTLIALFQPKPLRDTPEEAKRIRQMIEGFLPTRVCFPFDDSPMITKLMQAGATHEDAAAILPQLHLGGKACFAGRFKSEPAEGGESQGAASPAPTTASTKPMAVEMTGNNTCRIYEVVEPNVKEVLQQRGTFYGNWPR